MSTEGHCLYKRYVGDKDIEQFYITVGGRIRRERKAVGMSQGRLAVLIGITRPSLTLMESGRQRIQLHTLVDIAEALNVPVTYLLPTSTP